MNEHTTGWGSGNRTAPTADPTLIARAKSQGLEPGEPLSKLFVNPSVKAKQFLATLDKRACAALENASRTSPHRS